MKIASTIVALLASTMLVEAVPKGSKHLKIKPGILEMIKRAELAKGNVLSEREIRKRCPDDDCQVR
jgi:hypothetical protein